MRHFKAMLRKVDNTFVKDYVPSAELIESLAPGEWRRHFQGALRTAMAWLCESAATALKGHAAFPDLCSLHRNLEAIRTQREA